MSFIVISEQSGLYQRVHNEILYILVYEENNLVHFNGSFDIFGRIFADKWDFSQLFLMNVDW